jgi:hypothetical protein
MGYRVLKGIFDNKYTQTTVARTYKKPPTIKYGENNVFIKLEKLKLVKFRTDNFQQI